MSRLTNTVRKHLNLSLNTGVLKPQNPPQVDDQTRQVRIAELRREVQRILKKSHSPLPSMSGASHLRTTVPTTPATSPKPKALYSTRYSIGHGFGKTNLSLPGSLLLGAMSELLKLEEGRKPKRKLLPKDLLFLDTETTGLSRSAGTLAFLIGVGRFLGNGTAFRVDQLFLEDPAKEKKILNKLQTYLSKAKVLVTFNGRAFDLPLLRNRGILSRLELKLDLPHIDLLPCCRRFGRHRHTNCKLTTLERELLGFERVGDIDGSEVPRIYTDFLQTGDRNELDLVLEHNRLDIALLAPLLEQATNHLMNPLEWAEDGEELLSTGLFHIRKGNNDFGQVCLERGLELTRVGTTRQRLLVSLARHLRRKKNPIGASELWMQYCEEFPSHNLGWEEMAKHHEHTTKDLAQALLCAKTAPDQTNDSIMHRVNRLEKRLNKASGEPRVPIGLHDRGKSHRCKHRKARRRRISGIFD